MVDGQKMRTWGQPGDGSNYPGRKAEGWSLIANSGKKPFSSRKSSLLQFSISLVEVQSKKDHTPL